MAPKKKGGGKKGGGKGKGEKKPAKVLMYHDEEYWNDRYTKQPEPFDWYQSYKELKGLLNIYLPKDQVNVSVGCGNGLLGEEMVLDGYLNVISLDNSAVCFDQLNARYKGKNEYTGLTWFRQDVKELKMFKDLTIDNVIDKADALTNVAIVFGEIRRLEANTFWYVRDVQIVYKAFYERPKPSITYGNPLIRMPWLKTPATPWESIIVHLFPRPGSPKALKPSPRDILEPMYMLGDLTFGPQFNLDDPDWHYIYVCTKEKEDLTQPPPSKGKKASGGKGGRKK